MKRLECSGSWIVTLVSALLLFAACSAEVDHDPETGQVKITITGDDGQIVEAGSLEEALEKAQKCLVNAQNNNDPVGIKDWMKVINNLIDKKARGGKSSAGGMAKG